MLIVLIILGISVEWVGHPTCFLNACFGRPSHRVGA